MEVVRELISREKLKSIAENQFGNLVKAVVDIEQEIMVIGGELHADEEAVLIEQGSNQRNLWGINLYPAKTGDDFIEFDSMINIRPSQNNNSGSVGDAGIREKIRAIIAKLIKD
ncbi:MAG: hypothetical protein HYT39_02895 [Candidatus Sungbacteria bacterium]|nr:hypothetical protein [Candidatus Sungbacteria bacterium]